MTFKIDIEELIALLQREISCPDWPLLLSKTSSLFDIQQITDPPSNFISVEALLSYPAISSHAKIKRDIIQLLMDRQENPVKVKIHTKIPSYKTQSNLRSHNKIKNILAVVSGKGGVGKSTVTSYLALALQQEGARVGILDADIYGPSQPFLLGTEAIRPTITADKKFQPIIINGINMLSIGNLINENMPMIWRGPMVSKALQQLLYDTIWPDLDYLIVDLPPGTGDIQLTMAQKIPVSGAIIVTTSQDLSLLDAKKAAAMLEKVEISVLGIIENMSHFTCPNCQHVEAIFGSDLTKQWADKIEAPFLGSIPLHPIIRDATMQHKPAILSNKEHAVCDIYRQIARRVGIQLSLQERDLTVPVKLVSS